MPGMCAIILTKTSIYCFQELEKKEDVFDLLKV